MEWQKFDIPEEKCHLKEHLARMATKHGIPRKRTKFISWCRKTLTTTDEQVYGDLYGVLKSEFERVEGVQMDCVLKRLQQYYDDAWIVHRLDCETSGALVVALTLQAAQSMSQQFREKDVQKEYLALLYGEVKDDEGEVTLPIMPDPIRRPRQMVDHVNGKASRTTFKVLERDPVRSVTRVQLIPHTGKVFREFVLSIVCALIRLMDNGRSCADH